MFYELKFRLGLVFVRIPCVIWSCKIKRESSWNMPDDWHSPEWCDRCGATHDVYNIESTQYPLLDGTFMDRLKDWLAWNQ